MSGPFVGEIRMFAGNFAPVGWSFCNGALVPIDQNPTLFQLIGTTYGGYGQETFALPNLQSRVPVHVGPGFALGQSGGVETVTLTTSQIPAHSHVPQCFGAQAGNQAKPDGGVWATSNPTTYFASYTTNTTMSPPAIGSTGRSQPNNNMIPL